RAVGQRALARIVNPAHQVIVIVLLAHAAEVGGERAAFLLTAFTDRVTGHAAARLEGLFALLGVARRIYGQLAGDGGLPDERGDGLNLILVQAEGRHLGTGPPVVRILDPDREPLLVELHAHFLEAGADLLDLADEAVG